MRKTIGIVVLASGFALVGAACNHRQANQQQRSAVDQAVQQAQQAAQQAQQAAQQAQQAAQQAQQAANQANPQQAQNAQQPGQQATQSTSGRVARVSGDQITLDRLGQPQLVITVQQPVAVTLDGQIASLTDLPVGATAQVTYRQQGDQAIAQRIEASSKQPVRGTDQPSDQQQQAPQPPQQQP